MALHRCVHVTDADHTRRATIARQLYSQNLHAEIYETLDELVERSPSPGIAFINADDPFSTEEETIRRLRSPAGLPVVFYSREPSPERIVEAVHAGALDYLQWPSTAAVLGPKIERLIVVGAERAGAERRSQQAAQLVARLSPREREVLVGVVAGQSNKEIGYWLGISPRTVEIHRGNMMARLEVRSIAAVVRIGLQAGLTGDPADLAAGVPKIDLAA